MYSLVLLNNPGSSVVERATALQNIVEASAKADEALDEVWGIIFEILTDARNLYLGMPKGTLSNRWLDSFQKDTPPLV